MACLLTDHVVHLVVFNANPFQKFVVRHQVGVKCDLPGLRVGFQIGHGDFDIHAAEVAPVKVFGYAERIGGGVSEEVEPCSILQARCFDHKGVAFPVSGGIAEPVWVGVIGEATAVGEDLAILHVVFEEDRDERRGLNDLERGGDVINSRNTRGHTSGDGVVLALVVEALAIESRGPRLQRDAFRSQVCGDVVPIGFVGKDP